MGTVDAETLNIQIDNGNDIQEGRDQDESEGEHQTEQNLVNNDIHEHQENKSNRPKRNEIIQFTVNGETKSGRVSKVGKASGKDHHRCWIRFDGTEDSFDFIKEVDNWKVLPKKWYLAVKKELMEIGMRSISGDDAVFHLVKHDQLIGICVLHVDDFLTGGTPEFEKILDEKLKGRFSFGKIELNKFKFTGLNIEQKNDGIFVDQIEYIQTLKPIQTNRVANKDEKLNDIEFKAYRGLTGQLSWAAENSRPDLCFDVRELSTRNKYATYEDDHQANQVLKKAQIRDVK